LSGISAALRNGVTVRAQGRCEYCRIPTRGQVAWFPIDHIIPRSAGGETVSANLALACPRCNGHKWAFETGWDPQSGHEEPIFNPRSHSWTDHFEWAADGSLRILGKTSVGRATVQRLNMNEATVLGIRRVLVDLGLDVEGCL